MFVLANAVRHITGIPMSPQKLQKELQTIACDPGLIPLVSHRELFSSMVKQGWVSEKDGMITIDFPVNF